MVANPLATTIRFVGPTRGDGQLQLEPLQVFNFRLGYSLKLLGGRQIQTALDIFNVSNRGAYEQWLDNANQQYSPNYGLGRALQFPRVFQAVRPLRVLGRGVRPRRREAAGRLQRAQGDAMKAVRLSVLLMLCLRHHPAVRAAGSGHGDARTDPGPARLDGSRRLGAHLAPGTFRVRYGLDADALDAVSAPGTTTSTTTTPAGCWCRA